MNEWSYLGYLGYLTGLFLVGLSIYYCNCNISKRRTHMKIGMEPFFNLEFNKPKPRPTEDSVDL